jgi:hypothetical protein
MDNQTLVDIGGKTNLSIAGVHILPPWMRDYDYPILQITERSSRGRLNWKILEAKMPQSFVQGY